MSAEAEALLAKGLALEGAGAFAESVRCFAEVARLLPTAENYWHLIRTQVSANQLDQARQNCAFALGSYPEQAAFYQTLARLEEAFDNLDGATEILRKAAAVFPDRADILMEYATAQMRALRFAEAIPPLESIIALSPEAHLYKSLAKMRRAVGDIAGARRTLSEGLRRFPIDIPLAQECARFDPEALAASQKAMQDALATAAWSAATRSPFFRHLTEVQAAALRISSGKSPNGAADWTDLVRWADQDGIKAFTAALDRELSEPGARANAVVERAAAAVAQMDWVNAEKWFAEARRRSTKTVADLTVFEPDFYRRLEALTDDEIRSAFPPISEILRRDAWPETIIYVACDPKYFQLFMPQLLDSIVAQGAAGAGVHVHLMDGTEEEWAALAQSVESYKAVSISMTAEGGAAKQFGAKARNYYHAARYVRFYEYLARSPRPAWLLDVDLVFQDDPAPMFRILGDHDFAATTSAITLEPWSKIRAGLVGVAPTSAGLRFLRLVSAYIAHWRRNGSLRWGIDQQALFGCLFYLHHIGAAPKTAFLDERFMNDIDGLPCIVHPVMDAASRWKKARPRPAAVPAERS